VAGGDYVGALAAFDRFPQALASREWRRRVAAERAATARQASKRFAAVLAPAAKAAADGRLDEALRLYQGVRGSLLPGWRDELAGRVAAVRRRQQERAEREKVEAEAAHLRLLARVARLYKERQYGAAAALLKAKLDATTAARRAERERELAEIAHLESFWRSVAKGAAAFIGKPYSIRGIPGTISSVKDGRIEISTRGRPFREELIKLGTADAAKFARAALRGTEGSLAVARFLIAEGAAAEARARLAELEAAGADVAGSRERLERLRRSEVLGEATAALEKARQATDRAAALRDFVARYKGEPAAAALCAEAARMLKESPGPGPAPAATGPLPARLRVACDGAYKLFLNGKQIAAGAGYREGQFDLGELEVKHGDVLACEAVSRSAHRAFYALLSVGGGRYAIATQGSWRTSRDAPDGWQTAAEPPGTWREATLAYSPHAKPGYGEIARELPGYWVWGEGERCLFHKVVRFGRTVAERAAAERERERRLTEEHGESADARLRLECGGSYRLYHNGALVGCAAAAVPGVSYALSVRQGDVVGVHAVGGEQEGWLETRVEVDGCPVSLRSDRSWVYASAPEAEGWHKRGAPGGVWRAARSAGGGGHRIWGRGRAVLFRKTIDLAKLRSRHPEVALRVHGRMEGRGERRATVVYDFAEPEQLADWHGQEPPTWSQGRMHVGRGAVFTSLLDTRELEVEAALEPIGDFLLGLWGDEPGARSGYTLSVVGDRRATVVLRRGSHALWMEKVAVGSTVPRRITLRRYNRLFIVQINGRKVFSVRDTHPLPDGDVRRVGFMTGSRSKVGVRSFRLEGRLASARPNDRSPPRERPRRGDWPPWRRRDRERD